MQLSVSCNAFINPKEMKLLVTWYVMGWLLFKQKTIVLCEEMQINNYILLCRHDDVANPLMTLSSFRGVTAYVLTDKSLLYVLGQRVQPFLQVDQFQPFRKF